MKLTPILNIQCTASLNNNEFRSFRCYSRDNFFTVFYNNGKSCVLMVHILYMEIHSKRRRISGKYLNIKYNIILTTDCPAGVALKKQIKCVDRNSNITRLYG